MSTSAKRSTPHCTRTAFVRIVEHLRNVCPPARGFTVKCERHRRELDGFDSFGSTLKKGRVFTIQIALDMTETETEDTLIHEWAHMVAWSAHSPVTTDHSPAWGVALALVYCRYHGIT